MSNTSIISNDWDIGLCEFGDRNSCLYAWCCPACAIASSRTNLDGSSFAFNLFCVKPLVTTWLVKSAYDIKQDLVGDCLKLYCCFTGCIANQIYQTSQKRKNPTHDGGVLHNNQPLPKTWFPPTLAYFCGALACGNCVMASSLQKHVGMPWCLGCLCTGPFAGMHILRYQHRLEGPEDSAEFALGVIFEVCLQIHAVLGLAVYPIIASRQGVIQAECDRLGVNSDRYLHRMTVSGQDDTMVVMGEVMPPGTYSHLEMTTTTIATPLMTNGDYAYVQQKDF